MDRLNSRGVPRSQLPWVLKQRRLVNEARREDSCLLCRAKKVNEAGLCDLCYVLLTEEELVLAQKWLTGTGP